MVEIASKAVICPPSVEIAAFAATENFLWGYAAGNEDGLIRKWDFNLVANKNHENSSERADPITIWPVLKNSPNCQIHSLDVEPEGIWGICGLGNGEIHLFLTNRLSNHLEILNGQQLEGHIEHVFGGAKEGETFPISSLCILDNSSFLAGSWNASIKLYDLQVEKEIIQIHAGKTTLNGLNSIHKSQICAIRKVGNGDASSSHPHLFISTSVDGTSALWDLRMGKALNNAASTNHSSLVRCFRGMGNCWTFDCCPSRRSTGLAALGSSFYVGKRNGFIEEWSIDNDQQPIRMHKLPEESGPVTAVGCLEGGGGCGTAGGFSEERIIACSLDASRIINPHTGAVNIVQGSGGGVVAGVSISKDERFMVTVGGKRGWKHLTTAGNSPSTFYTINKRN